MHQSKIQRCSVKDPPSPLIYEHLQWWSVILHSLQDGLKSWLTRFACRRVIEMIHTEKCGSHELFLLDTYMMVEQGHHCKLGDRIPQVICHAFTVPLWPVCLPHNRRFSSHTSTGGHDMGLLMPECHSWNIDHTGLWCYHTKLSRAVHCWGLCLERHDSGCWSLADTITWKPDSHFQCS